MGGGGHFFSLTQEKPSGKKNEGKSRGVLAVPRDLTEVLEGREASYPALFTKKRANGCSPRVSFLNYCLLTYLVKVISVPLPSSLKNLIRTGTPFGKLDLSEDPAFSITFVPSMKSVFPHGVELSPM